MAEKKILLLLLSLVCAWVHGFRVSSLMTQKFTSIPPGRDSLKLSVGSGDEGDEAEVASSQPQMEVVPFDSFVDEFAKEDIPLEKVMGNVGSGISGDKKIKEKEKGQGLPQLGSNEKPLEQRLQEAYEKNLKRPREGGWIENPDRPTGYGIPDENDNEAEMLKQMEEDMASGKYVPDVPPDGVKDEFVRFLKDTYIGSPYDSRKKQQARYVIRNITGISVLFGIVFTAIWFAFPGKFISTAKDRDYTARYTDTDFFRAPSGLMDDNIGGSVDEQGFIGDAAPPAPQTRFDYDKPNIKLPRAPKPSVDL